MPSTKYSSTAIYTVSQVPNKFLEEPKATNSVRDNNHDGMEQEREASQHPCERDTFSFITACWEE